MAGRPPAVSDYEILRAVHAVLDDPDDPVATTGEVAERLPIKQEGLGRRLNALSESGLVRRKQVGVSYIWWLPEPTQRVVGWTGQKPAAGQPEPAPTQPDGSIETRLQELFTAGVEQFGLELGAVARVDADIDQFKLEYTSTEYEGFEPGTELPLSETYCTQAVSGDGPASVFDPHELGIDDRTVHADLGLRTYLGTLISPENGQDRTVFFVSSESRQEPFSEEECALHDVLAQGVAHEFERTNRSRIDA